MYYNFVLQCKWSVILDDPKNIYFIQSNHKQVRDDTLPKEITAT